MPGRDGPAAGSDVRYWNLPTGSRIAYSHVPASGAARPTPVVFLHGGPGTANDGVSPAGKALAADGFDVYAYDQLGAGRSSRLSDVTGYTVARQVADLDAIRREIGTEKIILVGQSWGGALAAHYMAAHDRARPARRDQPGRRARAGRRPGGGRALPRHALRVAARHDLPRTARPADAREPARLLRQPVHHPGRGHPARPAPPAARCAGADAHHAGRVRLQDVGGHLRLPAHAAGVLSRVRAGGRARHRHGPAGDVPRDAARLSPRPAPAAAGVHRLEAARRRRQRAPSPNRVRKASGRRGADRDRRDRRAGQPGADDRRDPPLTAAVPGPIGKGRTEGWPKDYPAVGELIRCPGKDLTCADCRTVGEARQGECGWCGGRSYAGDAPA
ncbi:alpha/beta fold hydrolase [Microtetraspora fusca]|uniref:alpha/beta fold hydrolase n=1 Tax=Microtetraspora fusca TaxID=1997 RepID=UPI003571228D